MEEEIRFLKERILFYEEIIRSLVQTKDINHLVEHIMEDMSIFEKKTQELFAKALCLKLMKIPIDEVKYICVLLYDKLKPEIIKLHNQVKDGDMHEEHKNDMRIKNFNFLQDESFQEILVKILKRNKH